MLLNLQEFFVFLKVLVYMYMWATLSLQEKIKDPFFPASLCFKQPIILFSSFEVKVTCEKGREEGTWVQKLIAKSLVF